MSDKLLELGIPPSEVTPAVSIAVSGLMAHIETLNNRLQQTREQLISLQNLIDVELSPAIPNRKAFVKRLDWTIAMARRYPGPACVIVFEMADYENINRTYGSLGATGAANHVAEILSNNIRDTDFFARLEDRQFGAILYFADRANAVIRAEKLAEELRTTPFDWNNGLINLQVFFGVHQLEPADGSESAVVSAVNAMYSKRALENFEPINFKA